MPKRLCFIATMLFALVALPAIGEEQQQRQRPEPAAPMFTITEVGALLEGSVTSLGKTLRFVVDETQSDSVILRFGFPGKQVIWRLGLEGDRAISLHTIGADTTLNDADRKLLNDLLYILQLQPRELTDVSNPANAHALSLLWKTTELMVEFPPGIPAQGRTTFDATKAVTKLCNYVGRSRTAYWDNAVQTRFKNFIVGGHGVCKGHCGAGCPVTPPGGGSPAYNYTQDCLNHDACHTEEGQQLGVCKDEWLAAADDFLSSACP